MDMNRTAEDFYIAIGCNYKIPPGDKIRYMHMLLPIGIELTWPSGRIHIGFLRKKRNPSIVRSVVNKEPGYWQWLCNIYRFYAGIAIGHRPMSEIDKEYLATHELKYVPR